LIFCAINTAQRTPQVFQILDTGSRLFLASIEFVQAKQSVGFKRFTFLQVYLICTYRLARSFPKRNAFGTRMHEDDTAGGPAAIPCENRGNANPKMRGSPGSKCPVGCFSLMGRHNAPGQARSIQQAASARFIDQDFLVDNGLLSTIKNTV
jgi:hypothetical protein